MDQEVGATEEPLTPDVPEDSRTSFVRNTAVMSLGTGLSRLTGFLRLAAMAYAIAIVKTRLTDAYNIANTTPNIVYELALGGILSSVFVPVFVDWLQAHGRDEAWDVARRILTITVVVLLAIGAIGIVAAPLVIRLYTVGISDPAQREATRALGSFFLRWFMPQIVFYGIGAVATGLLNAHRRFAAPMFAPILNNLVVIATFGIFAAMAGPARESADFVATSAQKYVLAVGTTLGVIAMTAALWPSLRQLGFRFRWRGDWRHEAVTRIARLAKWAIVYVVANQLGYLVVLILANGGKRGDYSAYVNAFVLFQLPHAIFAVSIFTALLPAMSGRWAAGERDAFRTYVVQGIRSTAFIVIPAALGYLVLATPIVRLLLQHGAAGAADTHRVAGILVFFAIGLFPFSAFQLLLRTFYSMQDTRTPALINIAAAILNTATNLLYYFVFHLGIRGLALGHATAYAFASIAAAWVLRGRLGELHGRRIAAGLSRVLLAGAATAGAAWLVGRVLGNAMGVASLGAQAVQVFGAVGAGLLVFVASALILRMEEVDMVKTMLASRLRR